MGSRAKDKTRPQQENHLFLAPPLPVQDRKKELESHMRAEKKHRERQNKENKSKEERNLMGTKKIFSLLKDDLNGVPFFIPFCSPFGCFLFSLIYLFYLVV